jgi:hypothetical protein
LGWPWGGLGWLWVACVVSPLFLLSTFCFLLLLELTWNQPRKGARDAARHSRSRSQNSLNAETQRFAEGRREGRKKRLSPRRSSAPSASLR